MPTRKGTAKRLIFTPSRSAYNFITRIKFKLNSDKLQELNNENKAVVEQINKVIAETETTLNAIPSQWVKIESFDELDKIEMLWLNLDKSYKGEVTEDFKDKYKESLEKTKDFFNSLSITPTGVHQTVSFRNKSTEDEQARLESLSKRRLEVKQLYEKALKDVPRNEERIKELKEQLDALGETYVETKKNLDGIKTDSAEEVRMRKRIDDAFDFLSKDNHLEKELTKLQCEFYVMLGLIAITVVVFFVFYGVFLCNLHILKLTGWCEYLPYTMSVPITIGLLWLFVYFLTSSSCHPRNRNHLIFLGKNAKNQVISRIGGRACYFMRLFARHPIRQEQSLIIKHLQACLKKVTKSGQDGASICLIQCLFR